MLVLEPEIAEPVAAKLADQTRPLALQAVFVNADDVAFQRARCTEHLGALRTAVLQCWGSFLSRILYKEISITERETLKEKESE